MITVGRYIVIQIMISIWLGSTLFLVLAVIYPQSLFAQEVAAIGIEQTEPRLPIDTMVDVTVDTTGNTTVDTSADVPGEQQDKTGDTAAITSRVLARPPLPFTEPQIGPLIKRTAPEDVNQWTTAFRPDSLDHLSPVEMPDEERWIRVDLSEQVVVAYEKEKPIRAFIISSGLPGTPTVTGQFRIRTKVSEQVMYGGEGANYYYLPGVKWVQYFYEEYSFHGTYWHNKFGQPMSHGCLNMTNVDAKWLFDWAGPTWDGETTWYWSSEENPGTLVIITE